MTPEDPLAEMAAQLANVDVPPVVDVTKLNVAELSSLLQTTRDQLFALGEMLEPRTDEARRLHSLRAAVLIELRKRGA